ncbi:hypothetical protein [Halorubrum lipolyticum]|uniref:Uncharacterized protein n=1 Tax=Halorubrum lipolyticum DSM 21995 TaxID=1227482 RepID=M0NGQ4_9EURY|nr:hypothetical protein [Halorubrum lipolyticum]EMA57162.1 hypothetical protein C469_15558 [Halorubrum lipolyticum DSM 21995]
MGLDTNTEVQQIRKVQNEQGDQVSPATEKQQMEIADRVGNHDGLTQIEVTTSGTDPEALPARDVPDGVEVLVEYREANSGNVYVGDENTQLSALAQIGDGRQFPVTDTSLIYIRTPTAGDGVIVTFEVAE